MLHRSRGVLAATPFQVLIACAKDLICNKVSTRFATQFSQIHDRFLHLNSTLTLKKPMQLRMFQLARLLHYGTKLLSCFSVTVWLFLSLTFFFFAFISCFCGAKIGGFGVALKNPSRWKSVTWYKLRFQRELVCFLQICPPFTFAEFVQKSGQRW